MSRFLTDNKSLSYLLQISAFKKKRKEKEKEY
jgi:hypothetical protein